MQDAESAANKSSQKVRLIHDWTRNPKSPHLTAFQRHVHDVDWTRSPLGPIAQWPDQLRQLVVQAMADPEPSAVYWGDERAIVYNEAYLPLIGSKHPGLQGQNPRLGGFAELWDPFDAIITEGELTGRTHVAADVLVHIHRQGFLEECYFSYKLIPVVGSAGYVVGSFTTASETTDKVISARRAAFSAQLTHAISSAMSVSEVWNLILQTFSIHRSDIVVADLYLYHPDKNVPSLYRPHAGPTNGEISDQQDLPSNDVLRGIATARELREPIQLTIEDGSLSADTFPASVTSDSEACVDRAIVWPIAVGAEFVAFMVLGINPRTPHNANFTHWLSRLVEEIIATKVSSILLAQEQQRALQLREETELERAIYFSRLREESKFSSFANRTTVGFVITSPTGDVLYANPSWYSWSGLTPGKITREDWAGYTVDEDASVIAQAWRGVTEDKKAVTVQVRTKKAFRGHSEQFGEMASPHKTGFMVAWPELNEQGDLSQVFGMVVDISELKWTEEQIQIRTQELEQSESKYRHFAERAPVGLLRMSTNGDIEFVNEAWTKMFDMVPKSGVKLPYLEVVHPDDLALCHESYEKLCNDGTPFTGEVRLQRTWHLPGHQHLSPQSVYILISAHTAPGTNGRPDHLVWWATDISSQKAAERTLANEVEETRRQKAQQEAFGDMISHEVRNPMSVIFHCVDEILQFSRSAEDRYVRPNDPLVHARKSAIEAAETILYCVDYQKRIIEDVMMLSKLDSGILEFSPSRVRILSMVDHVLAIFSDECRQLGVEFEVFASPAVHAEREFAFVDPSYLVQALINVLTNVILSARQSGIRHISISISCHDRIPQDDNIEFLHPARSSKYKTQQRGQSTVTFHSIKITETTHAKPLARQQELAEQLSSAKTHVKYGEAGLGLYITRRLIEEMNGRIGLARDSTAGNTICICLESKSQADDQSLSQTLAVTPATLLPITSSLMSAIDTPILAQRRSKSPSELLQSFSLSSSTARRLLVVEDNLVNQRVMCKQLRAHGLEVVAANHGAEALELLEAAVQARLRFDLILCDLEMPVMGGVECVKHIRRLETEGALQGRIPIIAVTANSRDEHVQSALLAGMDGVTTKPYRMNELLVEMQKYIKLPTGTC